MLFKNRTALDACRLQRMCASAVAEWPANGLRVEMRYSRGAAFSGSCYYAARRIFVNLGRDNRYPFLLHTHLARARGANGRWKRDVLGVNLADAYQLALFVFLHEFYHWLVYRSGRNVRQKEARCDRFAARVLVERYAAAVLRPDGSPASRAEWDFQDLEGFVASARRPEKGLAFGPQLDH